MATQRVTSFASSPASMSAVDTLALRCPTKTRSEISCPSDRSTSSSAPSRIETEVAALQ